MRALGADEVPVICIDPLSRPSSPPLPSLPHARYGPRIAPTLQGKSCGPTVCFFRKCAILAEQHGSKRPKAQPRASRLQSPGPPAQFTKRSHDEAARPLSTTDCRIPKRPHGHQGLALPTFAVVILLTRLHYLRRDQLCIKFRESHSERRLGPVRRENNKQSQRVSGT